ncbi:acyl carrier protein [Desulfovibrio litoralis]|uniref:Acyl carrier protein n=1 Tax=Desulfovibrio litoralis DSM 11393 TaxID=1121455 RepID=A0A1M7STP8_9BACT|nr:phosphopantetheine-binding protein [Desulfovibrio litoralis]SHN61811.1 acyl carrier protein [Desulfovibrio litoralis DSM 11393]
MTDNDIITRANTALAEEFELEVSSFVPEALFKEDLNLDSLDAVDMVIALEKEFGVKIGKDPQLSSIRTVNDLHQYLLKKKAELS